MRKLTPFVSLFALALVSSAYRMTSQEVQAGTIQGIVIREGSNDPLPEVQISVVLRGSLASSGFSAQQVLQAASRGAAVNPELVQAAQDSTRGGPRAAIANAPPLTATTDSAGRFTVRNVPAGENYVRAQLQNYFGPLVNGSRGPIASETVVVTTQQTTQVQLALVKGGTISGRVLDPTGKPLQNSPVQALQKGFDNGAPSFQLMNIKPTDDRGEFRLGVLPPGEYYVAVTPAPGGGRGAPGAQTPASVRPGEVAVTTLYPNTTDSTMAVPINLPAAGDLSGIDIQLRSVRGAKISGRVTNSLPPGPAPGGRGGTRPLIAVLGLAPSNKPSLEDIVGGGAGITAAEDGAFEISNVPPGSYDLFARLPIANGWGGLAPPERATTPLALGRARVEVNGGDVTSVTVLVHQGVDVKGRVTVDGQPPAANIIRLSLFPDDSAMRVNETQISNVIGQVAQYVPRIEQDGSFTFPVVPEGHYRLYAAPMTASGSLYVSDIRQGSTSIQDNGFTVGKEPLNPIEVTVNTNAGSVEGTVLNAERKVVPRTAVVLVPAPNRRSNNVLYKTVQTDAQGRFAITGVAPGTWKVFAWESVQPGAFQNSEFLEKYENRGTSVTVTAGLKSNADVTLIRN